MEKTDLMGHLGLEPRTIRLKAEYSTIELETPYYVFIIQNNSNFYKREPYSRITKGKKIVYQA